MRESILLIGGGGHCKSVIDVIEQQNKYNIFGIIDLKENIGKDVLGYKIIGCDEDLEEILKDCKNAVITVGHIKSNETRVRLFYTAKRLGYKFPVIISPYAYVSKHAFIDEGTVVMHHAIVNANAKVGKNCIINTKALVEHDAIIEDHCHISTAAVVNGGVVVKMHSFIGSNAFIREYTQIGSNVIVGGGVRVNKDVPSNTLLKTHCE